MSTEKIIADLHSSYEIVNNTSKDHFSYGSKCAAYRDVLLSLFNQVKDKYTIEESLNTSFIENEALIDYCFWDVLDFLTSDENLLRSKVCYYFFYALSLFNT